VRILARDAAGLDHLTTDMARLAQCRGVVDRKLRRGRCVSLQLRPGTEIVAVAFPPWWSTEQAFRAAAPADAAIVRMTAVPSLLVVRPHQHDGLTRLRKAGAWLAMDPQAIAACLSK
jgi:hypothetical protein